MTTFLPLWCFLSIWFVFQLAVLVGKVALPKRQGCFGVQRLRYAASLCCVLLVLFQYSDTRRLVFPIEAKDMVLNREAFLKSRLPGYGLINYLRLSNIEDKVIYQIAVGALFGGEPAPLFGRVQLTATSAAFYDIGQAPVDRYPGLPG